MLEISAPVGNGQTKREVIVEENGMQGALGELKQAPEIVQSSAAAMFRNTSQGQPPSIGPIPRKDNQVVTFAENAKELFSN